MKNYKQTASDVLRLVGGEKNVVQVEHCSTRLRFTLADTSKVDAAALKKTAGVMGVISSGPQCQVFIGNDVIEVYDELLKLGTFNAGQAAAPAAPKAAPAASGSGETVSSPMPGTILDVKVAAGQAVKSGDILFILEAMKMENEIFAPCDGTVSSVAVSKGAAVNPGDVLCVIG